MQLDVLNAAPPTEFRLFAYGKNRTTKGNFTLTKQGARDALAFAEAHGADVAIDYNHAMVDPSSADPALTGRAAGWCTLEARSDGLYAVGVTWTPEAAEMIRGRQYRYMSPAFLVNDDDEITQVVNIAITNLPATYGLTPLVASQAGRTKSMKVVAADDVHAHASKIGELAEAMDSTKLKTLSQGLHDLADGGKDVADEDAADGGADDAEENPDGSKKKAEAASQSAEPVAATAAGDVAALLSQLKRMAAPAQAPATAPAPSTDDALLAGLAREITGKTNASEIRGALLALSQGKGESTALHARVNDLERKLLEKDVSDVVRLATKAGRLRPAQREWAVKLGMADIASLKTFIEETPPVTAPASPSTVETTTAVATLTADEEKMIRIAGISRDAFLASKAKS